MPEEPDQQAELRAAGRIVALFVVAHVLVWWLVPLLTQPNIPLDVAEMHWWGQQWQAGYHKHPPLPAWIVAGVVDLGLGPSGIYLASQLLVAVCFASLWVVARRVVAPRKAAVAVLLLETIYYYNWPTPELNHNVTLLATWSASIAACWLAVYEGGLGRWLWFGVCLGLGLLSKYSAGVIGLLLLAWLILDPEARRCWRGPGPWLACVVAIGIFTPHLRWAAAHDWITLRYVETRSGGEPTSWLLRLWHPLKFILEQSAALIACLIAVANLRRQGGDATPIPPLAKRFLMAVVAGPVLCMALISLVSGGALRSMWGAPLWGVAPLALLVAASPSIDARKLRDVVIACGLIGGLLAIALAVRNVVGPAVTGKGERVNFNGPQLAHEAAVAWASVSDQALPAVGGPEWLAGNVSFYLPHHPAVYSSMQTRRGEWLDDAKFRQHGGVILWYLDRSERRFANEQADREIEDWLRRFPEAIVEPEIAMNYRPSSDLPPLSIGMAVVPPVSNR